MEFNGQDTVEVNEIEKRIKELRAEIAENNRRYYVENAPVVSDYDFDMMMNELMALEKAHPEFMTPDSPTMRVGSDLKEETADCLKRIWSGCCPCLAFPPT